MIWSRLIACPAGCSESIPGRSGRSGGAWRTPRAIRCHAGPAAVRTTGIRQRGRLWTRAHFLSYRWAHRRQADSASKSPHLTGEASRGSEPASSAGCLPSSPCLSEAHVTVRGDEHVGVSVGQLHFDGVVHVGNDRLDGRGVMCRHTVAGAALAHRAALEGSVLDHLRAGVPAVGDFGALGQLVLGGGGEVDHWSCLSVCSVYCHWLRVTAHALGMSTLS